MKIKTKLCYFKIKNNNHDGIFATKSLALNIPNNLAGHYSAAFKIHQQPFNEMEEISFTKKKYMTK